MQLRLEILLDENCSYLAGRLLAFGWEVVTIKEVLDRPAGQNSVSDDRILRYAKENKYVIITKDKGLSVNCRTEKTPCINLSVLYDEARIVDSKLKEMLSWKEFL